MPSDPDTLLRRLIGGDEAAPAEILEQAASDDTPTLLVAAALVAPDSAELLARAAEQATTTRDRQLVAIAEAHLGGRDDLLDVLVRDHLADHPDSLLAAWIATQHAVATRPTARPTTTNP